MVESNDWSWIDELLKEFGHDNFNTLGFYCKMNAWGCLSCEFFNRCNRRPPEKVLSKRFDIVGDNLEKDRLPKILKPQEFRYGNKREIPKARMPFWLREKVKRDAYITIEGV